VFCGDCWLILTTHVFDRTVIVNLALKTLEYSAFDHTVATGCHCGLRIDSSKPVGEVDEAIINSDARCATPSNSNTSNNIIFKRHHFEHLTLHVRKILGAATDGLGKLEQHPRTIRDEYW